MRHPYLLALVSMLGGCIHLEQYPETWQPIVSRQGTDCAELMGKYLDSGEISSGGKVSLAAFLTPKSADLQHPALSFQPSQVELGVLQEKILKVIFTDANSNLSELSFSRDKGEFDCGGGVLTLKQDSALFSDKDVLVVGFWRLNVYRLQDQLVVSDYGGGAGFVSIFPAMLYMKRWARFKVVE